MGILIVFSSFTASFIMEIGNGMGDLVADKRGLSQILQIIKKSMQFIHSFTGT
jgi:hypothetical protein